MHGHCSCGVSLLSSVASGKDAVAEVLTAANLRYETSDQISLTEPTSAAARRGRVRTGRERGLMDTALFPHFASTVVNLLEFRMGIFGNLPFDRGVATAV